MANLTSGNPWINITQTLQDIEQVQFAQQLQGNPDDFNKYVSERVERITGETLDAKRSAFQKAQSDFGRYMDMEHNSSFYTIRNEDVLKLQESMIEKTQGGISGLRHDKENTRRQTEINEWYYNDKLETVFFLQLFFIVMLAMTIVIFLFKNGLISTPFATLVTVLLMAGVTLVGLYRNRYTNVDRDGRFWSKRVFYKPPKNPSKEACPCATLDTSPSAFGVAISDAQKCAEKGLKRLEGVGEGVGTIMSPYGDIVMGMGGGLVGSVVGGVSQIGSQVFSDTKKGVSNLSDIGNRYQQQVEADAKAYLTGVGRPKPSARGFSTCPF